MIRVVNFNNKMTKHQSSTKFKFMNTKEEISSEQVLWKYLEKKQSEATLLKWKCD